MTPPSVSFRISRHTEDLAETIHALSQRLVALEQRLEAMELRLARQEREPAPEELASLTNVERLLKDCRDLLAPTAEPPSTTEWSADEGLAESPTLLTPPERQAA